MAYIVTARKWRPMVFEDIVGQSHIATTLRNSISSNRLSHAYIFGGPRGVGKTTTARVLAKAINCLHPVDTNPDNRCELCTEITEGRSLNVFEIDPIVSGQNLANPSARLTVGRQINNNLRVTYSTNLSQDQNQVLALEYRVSNKLSFVAQYEQRALSNVTRNRDNFSFEIRFRRRF